MPAQGWAGAQQPVNGILKCAVCIVRDDRFTDAITQIQGNLVCLEHAKEREVLWL